MNLHKHNSTLVKNAKLKQRRTLRDNQREAMHSLENNEQSGRYVPRPANRVELTFHGVALFSRKRIGPRVEYPFEYHGYNLTHLPLEMCSTSTEVASKFTK